MYLLLSFVISCVLVAPLFGCDEETRKQNEQAALKSWLRGNNSDQRDWGFDTLERKTCALFTEFKMADLKSTQAIEAGKELLQLFPANNELLLPLKEALCRDIIVREEIVKSNPDYNLLVQEALYTENHTAHKHIFDRIIQSHTNKHSEYLLSYFYTLTDKEKAASFELALKRSVAASGQPHNAFTVFEMAQYGLPNSLEATARELFANKHNFSMALNNTMILLPDSYVGDALMASESSAKEIVTLQTLVSLHCKDFSDAQSRLAKHPAIIPFFISSIGLLIKDNKNDWQKISRFFLSTFFTQESYASLRLPIATELYKRYESAGSASWPSLSVWLRCAVNHYMVQHKHETLSDAKLLQLVRDFCTIEVKKLTSDRKKYGEHVAAELFEKVYKVQHGKQKKEIYEQFVKAGWDWPLQHDLKVGQTEAYLSNADILSMVERHKKSLSADSCYLIAQYYQRVNLAAKAYDWFILSAHNGSVQGFEQGMTYGLMHNKKDDLLQCARALVCSNPEDKKIEILRDLLTFKHIDSCPQEERKSRFGKYLDTCLKARGNDIKFIEDPMLLSQALYAKAYALLYLAYDCKVNININSVVTHFKHAYNLSRIVGDTTLFDPLCVMPTVMIEAFERQIEQAEYVDEVAFATVMLIEQLHRGQYNDNTMIARGLRYIFSYGQDIDSSFLFQKCSREWCNAVSKKDAHVLLFMTSLEQPLLENCLGKDSTLDTIKLCARIGNSPTKELSIALKKSKFCDSLRILAQGDSLAAQRAMRLFLCYELFDSLDEAKGYAGRLNTVYKNSGQVELMYEAIDCYKKFVQQGISESSQRIKEEVKNSHIYFFQKLRTETLTDKDKEDIRQFLQHNITNPIAHVIQAGTRALEYGKDDLVINKMIVLLEQTRRLGSIQPASKWRSYVTPRVQEILWKEATNCGENMHDLAVVAYAVFLNQSESIKEKKELLQKGLNKHPFVSLLYARCLIEEGGCAIKQLPWEERCIVYKALHYAIMQGQRSTTLALDGVTQKEAINLLDQAYNFDDLGAALIFSSVESDFKLRCGYIGALPFTSIVGKLVFDMPADNYINLARDFQLIEPLEAAAQKDDAGAQGALFRLYFAQACDCLTTNEMEQEQIAFVEKTMRYSIGYIKNKNLPIDQRSLAKTHVLALINHMIQKKINVSVFKKLKTTIENS